MVVCEIGWIRVPEISAGTLNYFAIRELDFHILAGTDPEQNGATFEVLILKNLSISQNIFFQNLFKIFMHSCKNVIFWKNSLAKVQ